MAPTSIEWTFDLFCCVALALFVPLAVLVVGILGPVRAVVTLPFLLFVPGYAFLCAVYPEQYEPSTTRHDSSHPLASARAQAGIPPGERLVLSVLVSLALSPFLALGLNFTRFGVRATPLVVGVGGLTLALSLLALARRVRLPVSRRGGLPFAATGDGDRGRSSGRRGTDGRLTSGESARSSTRETVLNGIVIVALLLVPVSAAFAYTAPTAGQSFTEFAVTGQNETGNYTVEALPTTLEPGDDGTVHVTITNQEGASRTYTVVAMVQRGDRTDGEFTVQSSRRLESVQRQVDDGETVRFPHSLGQLESGGDHRVVYLLYRGDAPANPTRANAYRSLRLWVTVSDTGTANESLHGAST